MQKINWKTYFTKGEWCLWGTSIFCILVSHFALEATSLLTLVASLIGVTSLLFNAKGNPFGQLLMILFSLLYGIISFRFSYYGEMITYLAMTMPMAAFSLISWLRHPYAKDKIEVKVHHLSKQEWIQLWIVTAMVTFGFYFILQYFSTKNLGLSTLSVTTSYLAVVLTYKRSSYFAMAYAANDLVLIGLWILATLETTSYLSVVICFVVFTINDLYGYYNWKKMALRQTKKKQT